MPYATIPSVYPPLASRPRAIRPRIATEPLCVHLNINISEAQEEWLLREAGRQGGKGTVIRGLIRQAMALGAAKT